MTERLKTKLHRLQYILKKYPGVAVAFSGGVDSSLLLKVARDSLGDKVIAVTGASPLYPHSETLVAKRMTRLLRVRHMIIRTTEMESPVFVKNPRNRCYHCKLQLFHDIREIARIHGYAVVEASNRSDLSDFRPGLNAARRRGVVSPLIQAGLTKDEIRTLAKHFRLPNWNKPSMACLASRIPYGHVIDEKTVKRIERAERYLKNTGLTQVRVRDHYPVARIEVLEKEMAAVICQRKKIARYLVGLGYKYVALDLESYRTGSMNK
ncbi:MAG TPA: ATP-dependent sacrificial sulfur transferase LarE [bacterium]